MRLRPKATWTVDGTAQDVDGAPDRDAIVDGRCRGAKQFQISQSRRTLAGTGLRQSAIVEPFGCGGRVAHDVVKRTRRRFVASIIKQCESELECHGNIFGSLLQRPRYEAGEPIAYVGGFRARRRQREIAAVFGDGFGGIGQFLVRTCEVVSEPLVTGIERGGTGEGIARGRLVTDQRRLLAGRSQTLRFDVVAPRDHALSDRRHRTPRCRAGGQRALGRKRLRVRWRRCARQCAGSKCQQPGGSSPDGAINER